MVVTRHNDDTEYLVPSCAERRYYFVSHRSCVRRETLRESSSLDLYSLKNIALLHSTTIINVFRRDRSAIVCVRHSEYRAVRQKGNRSSPDSPNILVLYES